MHKEVLSFIYANNVRTILNLLFNKVKPSMIRNHMYGMHARTKQFTINIDSKNIELQLCLKHELWLLFECSLYCLRVAFIQDLLVGYKGPSSG